MSYRNFFALLLGLMFLSGAERASAQCGYGTSEQDCQHQQRDAQAASEAGLEHRRQMESQGSEPANYGQPSISGRSRPSYGFVAVVWHSDATDVWATWNRSSEEDANIAALNACRRAMGDGCNVALSAWNSTIAVALAPDGALRVGWGVNPQEAEYRALESCSRYLRGCSIKHRFTAKPNSVAADYFPREVSRASYAMLAWPKSHPGPDWVNKVWISSGQGGYQRTSSLVLDLCKRDTGIDCQITQMAIADTGTTKGGVVGSYYNPRRGTMWFASPSKAAAKESMERECRADNAVCENLTTYDAFSPRLQTLPQSPPR